MSTTMTTQETKDGVNKKHDPYTETKNFVKRRDNVNTGDTTSNKRQHQTQNIMSNR